MMLEERNRACSFSLTKIEFRNQELVVPKMHKIDSLEGLVTYVNINLLDDHYSERAANGTIYSGAAWELNDTKYTLSLNYNVENSLYTNLFEITGENHISAIAAVFINDGINLQKFSIAEMFPVDKRLLKGKSQVDKITIDANGEIIYASNDIKYNINFRIILAKSKSRWYVSDFVISVDKDVGDKIMDLLKKRINQRLVLAYQ